MRLSNFLQEFISIPEQWDREVTELTLDSRQAQANTVFFALPGSQQNGLNYIDDAINHGATAIIAEGDSEFFAKGKTPIWFIPNLKKHLSDIAANFYQHPADQLKLIGITGTNGKTSCSHFIASALFHLNMKSAVIGTIGNGLFEKIKPAQLTTPDAINLQKLFKELVAEHAQVVAMEVSSHSLDQYRVGDLPFEVGIFTNLNRDHLDYHGTMEAYGAAKKRLFEMSKLKHAVINVDDDFGKSLISSVNKNAIAFSLNGPYKNFPTVYAQNIMTHAKGFVAQVNTPWGQGELTSQLIGTFNVSNLLASLASLCLLGVLFKSALSSLEKIQPVAGRMEMVGGGDQPLVVIDYSHKPDALGKALKALKDHCEGKLLCVFGCGGNRDRGKRPLMAQIAEEYADFIIVTDDNPRFEKSEDIINDIMQGFKDISRIKIQPDRSKAIKEVIQCAKAGDCILIAGKGAEEYQQIGDRRIPFKDIDKVKENLLSFATAK